MMVDGWPRMNIKVAVDIEPSGQATIRLPQGRAEHVSEHVTRQNERDEWSAWLGQEFCNMVHKATRRSSTNHELLQRAWQRAADRFFEKIQEALLAPLVVAFRRYEDGAWRSEREAVLSNSALAVLSRETHPCVITCFFFIFSGSGVDDFSGALAP